MQEEEIIQQLRTIVALLSERAFDLLYEIDMCKRIPASEMAEALDQYPGTFTYPPPDAFEGPDVYEVSANEVRVDFDLWVDGEESDLTLCCSFYNMEGRIGFCVDDIHVL